MEKDIEQKNEIEDNREGKDIDLEEFKKKLEECEKLKSEYLAGWQRSRADFLNYKREEMERIGEILKYASEELILKILPILDNFDLVTKNLPDYNPPATLTPSPVNELKKDPWVEGVFQIKTQFQDFLKSQGVEEIKCLGQKFDPNFQEVIEEIETKDKEPGIVIEEIQKGYKINGRLLRPAKVRVTK